VSGLARGVARHAGNAACLVGHQYRSFMSAIPPKADIRIWLEWKMAGIAQGNRAALYVAKAA
jgi:hypothetical protein